MSSRDGLARADVDTGLFSDSKVKRLARLQRDSAKTAATMTLYVATVLESWSENDRVTAEDALPAWYLDDPSELIADLVTVGLLDESHLVPEASLDRWMAGVRQRSAAGRAGAAARYDRNGTASDRNGTASDRSAQPASLPASQPARAKDRGASESVRSLRQILAETTGEPEIVNDKKETKR